MRLRRSSVRQKLDLQVVVSFSSECVEVGDSNDHAELGGVDINLEFKRTFSQRRSRRGSF